MDLFNSQTSVLNSSQYYWHTHAVFLLQIPILSSFEFLAASESLLSFKRALFQQDGFLGVHQERCALCCFSSLFTQFFLSVLPSSDPFFVYIPTPLLRTSAAGGEDAGSTGR